MRTAKVVLVFFVCGLALSLCFGGLLSVKSLESFWYWKSDKWLIPTYHYYVGVGLFLLLSLATAYSISKLTGLLRENSPLVRTIVSAVIVGTSPLILFAAAKTVEEKTATKVVTDRGTILFTNIDPITLQLWGIVAFVLLISIACWILTAKLYYFGVFLNFLTLPAGLGLLYVVSTLVAGRWSVTYPVYFSVLSASCGFWIAKAPPQMTVGN